MPSIPGKPLFQTYILPVIPFRRRHSSNTSTSTATSDDSAISAALNEPPFLSPTPRSTISCYKCHAELALTSQIISKGFTGRHGRAYLVAPTDPTSAAALSPVVPSPANGATRAGASAAYPSASSSARHADASGKTADPFTTALPNTYTSKPVPRHLVTGLHTVCDVSCAVCASVLGWKYIGAEEDSQRYKVGKFILETRRTVVGCCWEDRGVDGDDMDGSGGGRVERRVAGRGEGVMFDSADEDECEELFSGVWNENVARRRRARRVGR